MRLLIFTGLLALFIGTAIYPLYVRYAYVMQADKVITLTANADACQVLEGPVGAEDAAIISNDIVIFGSDDRMTLWEVANGAYKAKNGSLVVVHSTNGETRVSTLPLHNFPENTAFHPHGIYLFRANDEMLLYVINHAYFAGGERVDVFKVQHVSPSKENEFAPISVTYEFTLGREYLSKNSMGCANDLVVVKPGEFFITQYLAIPDTPNGRITGSFLGDTWRELGNIFALITGRHWTYVRRCTYDPQSSATSKEIQCDIVASGISYNGINVNNAKDVLFVSQPTERDIHAYKLTSNGEPLELLKNIQLPYGVDNIELDTKTDTLFLSAIGSVALHFDRVQTRISGKGRPTTCPGGAMILSFDSDSSSYSINQAVMQSGDKVSSISVACPYQENFVLLGSWEDTGILLCPLIQ